MRLIDRSGRTSSSRWLGLYPRDWRDRYQAELLDLLESEPPDARARRDLVHGAFDAHLHPLRAPDPPVASALVAGVAWVAAGLASATQPLMPDWPGFLLETLPLGAIGALSALRAVTQLARRSGLDAPHGTSPAVVVAVAGHLFWIVAIVGAALGGPYGAVTGAAGALAAVGTMLVGFVRSRGDDHPTAEGLVIAGAAMLVPSPVAWVVAGAAWIALAALGLRPVRPLRPA
jgi:hypothetical protein